MFHDFRAATRPLGYRIAFCTWTRIPLMCRVQCCDPHNEFPRKILVRDWS